MKKCDIRREIKAQKKQLSDEDKTLAAEKTFAHLEKTADFMLADKILIYYSLPDELPTHSFIRKWCDRKRFYLPRVCGDELEILPYDESRLSVGSFNIEEPTGDETASISDMELIIVPAVAFDRSGNRVGRGKGYYDRLLSGCQVRKIGIAYGFQLVDNIESEPHDIRVDSIITDNDVIDTHQSR